MAPIVDVQAIRNSLQRYAAMFNAVEINSPFHRPHRPATWERWRDSVPAGFRFSVKLAKEITHERKLRDCAEPLARFMDQVGILDDKLAVILVQLPPKHEFEERGAGAFLAELRQRSHADIVCEPRHLSWFTPSGPSVSAVRRSDTTSKPGRIRSISRMNASATLFASVSSIRPSIRMKSRFLPTSA